MARQKAAKPQSLKKSPGDCSSGGSSAVAALDWERIERDLDELGHAIVGPLLSAGECHHLRETYAEDSRFRRHIVMARHGYGRGEYKYFAYPLPAIVEQLRATLYPPLATVANRWNAALGIDTTFPAQLAQFTRRCHQAGQQKPTPLILRYETGDFNCLHQDVYGEHVFPLQVAILLSDPEQDFSGGEFILTEQRPRMQSRAEVEALQQGCGVIFPVRHRPVRGKRGYHRVNMRHGVSRIRSGLRFTLGIIFHDAQ